jgi:hypothetical protein
MGHTSEQTEKKIEDAVIFREDFWREEDPKWVRRLVVEVQEVKRP